MSDTGNKNVFIVYAHSEPNSFNAALKNVAVKTLTDKGHVVKVSDLYAMNFKATATRNDISGPGDNRTKPFQYGEESGVAYTEGRLSSDIIDEIEKLKWADLVIFQYPLYWYGLPSILKGWFDRVLVENATYTVPDKMFSTGTFMGKRAMLSCTTGAPEEMYGPCGINGEMKMMLWPVENGCLNFVGYSVLNPHICYGLFESSDEYRKKILKDWEERLVGLFNEKPQRFFSRDDFENDGFGPLKPEALERAKKDGDVPIGQMRASYPQSSGGI